MRPPEIKISYKQKLPLMERPQIGSSRDAFEVAFQLFDKNVIQMVEEVYLLTLNRANRVTGWVRISTGGIDSSVVDTRMVFAIALKSLACGIILVHNHPSGNLKPSFSDDAIASRFKEAGKLLSIQFLDSMIVTPEGKYYSYADEGRL